MFRPHQIITFTTDKEEFVKRSFVVHQGEFADKRVFIFDFPALYDSTSALTKVFDSEQVNDWMKANGFHN